MNQPVSSTDRMYPMRFIRNRTDERLAQPPRLVNELGLFIKRLDEIANHVGLAVVSGFDDQEVFAVIRGSPHDQAVDAADDVCDELVGSTCAHFEDLYGP